MTSRRRMLSILSVGAVGSLAGCSGLIEGFEPEVSIPLGSDEHTPTSTPQQVGRETKSTESEIAERLAQQANAARSYQEAIPETWPSDETFAYDSIESELTDFRIASRVIAESGGSGDRLLLTPNELSPGETAAALRGYWGVPETEQISTSIQNSQVDLVGGDGVLLAGFAGVVRLEDGSHVAAVRGVDRSVAEEMAGSFELVLE